MKVSIVAATYNRAHLLRRALVCYLNMDFDDFELIYVDDWSEDETDELLREYARQMRLIVIRPPYKTPGHWRSEASIINIGLRAAKGQLIIATHPEVMVGRRTVRSMWERRKENTYLSCRIYYLTVEQQQQLDSVPWSQQLMSVRTLPNFYAQPSAVKDGPAADYAHINMDRHTAWESWVFGGMLRETWRRLGGFYEFETWGSVDVDFLNRRRLLGIKTETLVEDEEYCLHQNHDLPQGKFVVTPRDMNRALGALPHYRSPSEARLDHLW